MTADPLAARLRTALVTGASAGLGAAMVRELTRRGLRVWGAARDAARVDPAAFASGGGALAADLSLPGEAERLASEAEAASGGIDLLINNAGAAVFGAFTRRRLEDCRAQWELLVLAPAACCRVILPGQLRRGRGAVVNVSSLAAEFPLPGLAAYNAGKAALCALSQSLILELEGRGVQVVDFRPGDVRTGFNRAMAGLGAAASPECAPPEAWERGAWEALERHLLAAPEVEAVLRPLWRRLESGRSGVLRSGGLLQARVAPVFSRLIPEGLWRAWQRRYCGLSRPL